jgi:hypothetical protein
MVMTGAAAPRAIVAVACCLGLAACGGRHALMAASASSASPATPTGTPTPHRTLSPAATPTLAGPSHTAVCRTSQLKITILRSLAAGGTAGGYLGFTSHAGRPCILSGWPTLVGVTAAGKTSTAIRRFTMMFGPTVNGVPVVTLKPGALAVAVFTVADGRPPYCPPALPAPAHHAARQRPAHRDLRLA